MTEKRAIFGIERNIAAVSVAMFVVGLGESLWTKFMPRYLQALGAPAYAIGAYGSIQDLLDGLYQYPGGWLGDRLGRRRALMLFIACAMAGYLIYIAAPSWQIAIAGLLFVMAWSSMASPTLFAVVGDALPRGRRAIGFTVQALLKRLPLVIGPIIGGIAIERMGVTGGMRAMLCVTIVLATAALAAARVVDLPRVSDEQRTNMLSVWRSFPSDLRTLLVADVLARIAEALVNVFLVIYVTVIAGLSPAQYGLLVAVQSLTSMVIYLPAAKISDRGNIKGVVITTFIFFAAFPLAVVSASGFWTLMLAFFIGGLREFGEPSRKSMIVDFAAPSVRARSVGLYYLLRSVTIAPSAMIGALLWAVNPRLPFYAAFGAGLVGAAVFAIAVRPPREEKV